MNKHNFSNNALAGKYIAFASILTCLLSIGQILLLKKVFTGYEGFRFIFYFILVVAIICLILNLNNFKVVCPKCGKASLLHYPHRHCPDCGEELLMPWKEADTKGAFLSKKSYVFMGLSLCFLIASVISQTVYMNNTTLNYATIVKVMDLPEDGTYEGITIDHSKYKNFYVVEAYDTYAVIGANDTPVSAVWIATPSNFKETGIAYRCANHGKDDTMHMLHTYRDRESFLKHYEESHNTSAINLNLFRWMVSLFGMILLIYVLLWFYHVVLWKMLG